jgi:hypothetical protein
MEAADDKPKIFRPQFVKKRLPANDYPGWKVYLVDEAFSQKPEKTGKMLFLK